MTEKLHTAVNGLLAVLGVAALAVLLSPSSAVAESSSPSGQVSVTATVDGIRVVLFDEDGQVDQIWTNTRQADPSVRFRVGSLNGPDITPSFEHLEAYREVMLAIEPGAQPGMIWQRPETLSQ
jgi:hypothetical protein